MMYLEFFNPRHSPTKLFKERYYRSVWRGDICAWKSKEEADDWSAGNGAEQTEGEANPPAISPASSKTTEPPPSADDGRRTPPKPDPEDKHPRIRLKTSLATDPALMTAAASLAVANVKAEVDTSQSPGEYLASLPPVIQSALAARGFFLPTPLTITDTTSVSTSAIPPARAVEPADPRPSVPIYQCLPCGIRFSSLSTLEAHQTYYCSHRANKTDEDSKSTNAEAGGNQSDVDSEPASKNQRTGKQYTCSHCSYSADKKVSLNRHMRMHTVSPSPATTSAAPVSNGEQASDSPDRYCAECDIRFSSQKTYRAHKMHYCNSRHMIKSLVPPAKAASSCTSGSSPTSPVDTSTCRTPPSPSAPVPPQQPFLALPTNPIIIVPYSLFRSASVLPGLSAATGLPTPETPCFLLPNGTLQPIPPTPVTLQQPEVLKSVNKPKEATVSKESSSAPLDLTMKKSPSRKDESDVGNDNEKENLKRRSLSPEKIECVPSLHGSPPLTPASFASVSPKRKYEETSRSNSPRQSRTPKTAQTEKSSRTSPDVNAMPPAFDLPPSLHPLLLRPGALPLFTPEVQLRLAELPTIPPVVPQVLVKQGVSKCKECNIVFCKHENYVIHKKHYCSARNLEDETSKTSSSPPVSPRSGGTTSPATQYQQLICLACGIKFTSPDNLNAHQQYYCLKRGELDVRKCAKCKSIAEPGHQCLQPAVATGWKCPCCEVVSSTASAAQRHLESHTAVKAYRCTICRYKGNTLRGMRTHIRMHFDKRSPDLQEEKYISCILEDEASNTMEVGVVPPAAVTEDRAVSPDSDGRVEPLHHCNYCPYSSVYKANVQRHMKLVHEVNNAEDSLPNGSEDKTRTLSTEDDEEIIIKKEAIEPEVIIASVEEGTIKQEPLEAKGKTSREEAEMAGKKYCKSCDITFNYYSSFLAHKKFYCSSHAGEITAANANNNNNNPNTRTAETSVL